MSYRLNTLLKPLIWVECKVRNFSSSRIEIHARVRAQFKTKSHANNVDIIIPVPDDADSPHFKCSQGSIKWKPELSAIVWHIKKLGGGKEVTMKAELGLPSVRGDGSATSGESSSAGVYAGNGSGSSAPAALFGQNKRPISVKFNVPFFTTSGIQVRYLKIIEPKMQYPSYPWVRYITKSGEDYTIRMAV